MSTLYSGDLLDGRYRIATAIARGGMSTVYAAVDTRLDREVAVKVMESSLAHDRTFRTRFEREARAVARLSHPSLVNVFDQGVDYTYGDATGELVFLVMELVRGGSLRELLRERGPMPPHAVVAVMRPVLTALSVAHSTGMIHRDIKPDNVLIGEDHQVKLSDFGLVRAIDSSSDTSHGQVIGTAAYLSPEQVRGRSLTQASDVYSAGILMFELITGTTPFRGATPVETATARLGNEVPLPSTRAEGVPQEFDDIVATACHLDPEQRYVDGQEFLDDLIEVAQQLGIPPFKVPVPRNSKVMAALQGADFGERKAWNDDSMATRTVNIPPEEIPREPLEDPEQDFSGTDAFERYETRPWTAPNQLGTAAGTGIAGSAGAAGAAHAHGNVPNNMPSNVPPVAPATPLQRAPLQVGPTNQQASKPLSNRSAGRTIVWLIVIIALVASVSIGAWWLTSGRYGEVPSVLGMDKTAAVSTMDDAGFTSTVTEQYSDDTPTGGVIGTEPPFGQRALHGSQVVVLVSKGKPVVPAPTDKDTAASYIQALNARTLNGVVGDEEYSDSVPAGDIVSVDPSPNTAVDTNSQVTIHISKGPEPVSVPDVKGSSESKARSDIKDAGLKVKEVVEEDSDSVKAGKVTRTDPPAGTELTKDAEVTIYIAAQATVPLVFGMSGNDAKTKLEGLGFKVKIDGKDNGIVYTQTPGPTAKVAKGSTVTIKTL